MPNPISGQGSPGRHSSTRDLAELAALFVAAGIADLFANTLSLNRTGPYVLFGLGALLIAIAMGTRWWRRRTRSTEGTATSLDARVLPGVDARVWRIRCTVRDTPGGLAALAGGLAAHRIDIASVQVHTVADGAVDEFLVRAPAAADVDGVVAAVAEGGGREIRAERADPHDLVDVPTRVLLVAADAVSGGTGLPKALRALLGDCTIRWTAPPQGSVGSDADSDTHPGTHPDAGGVGGRIMQLPDPEGGMLVVERPSFPFTPAEYARARALLELDRRLAERAGAQRERLRLPTGIEVSIRQARRTDTGLVRDLHGRCGAESLRLRYLGADPATPPVLDRLLSRRHGLALLVESPSGEAVALGNLLWDNDIAEIAVLVADGWQRRGIGDELVRRLLAAARDAGNESVYGAVACGNRPMLRLMQRHGARLDEIEAGTAWLSVPLLDRDRAAAGAEGQVAGPRGCG